MILLALVPLAAASLSEVTVKPETYRGWSGAYRISNGVVDLVVVPKIGRVMRFGYVNQRNLLWENPRLDGASKVVAGSYANYGGDKMWPAPQSLWSWPPDPKLDGAPYQFEAIPNGVRLTSPVGGKVKVRIVREITLDPLAPEARFRNRMDNLGPRQELAAWQITQTANPDLVTIPFDPAPGLPNGWHGFGNERLKSEFHTLQAGTLRVRRDPNQSRKFGAFHRTGELTATFGSTTLRSTSPALRGQRYVERNSPLQVYTNADPDAYVELEHTSPIQRMDTGESAFLNVTWRLSTRP